MAPFGTVGSLPPTLNGNASLGQHSMALHMELQHDHQCVCGGLSHVYMHVCMFARGLGDEPGEQLCPQPSAGGHLTPVELDLTHC